ncbi:MAG: DUF3656 domain-containing protein [Lachnospira sp.]
MGKNNYYKDNKSIVEVLAPAGSLDICKAVIRAGADAVYLGGTMFGARAFAGNLGYEEMLEAIAYAHRFGRRIYLTVNTLLKEDEIQQRLTDYIKPYYEASLDAVIVQDLGVLKVLKDNFPDLPIHASTQMTQTGFLGAKIVFDAGADRVVTSREMTLSEIKLLHNKLPELEIESFVHGALCYCYSGQCLLSSFSGGRSGNRGRCAQPCRLPYAAFEYKNKNPKQFMGNNTEDDLKESIRISNNNEKYLMSPKDMCALSVLPDIIDAGVYSLKIEGRMKNVTYAAFVTHIYRKYVDMYLKRGREGYKVDESDVNALMDIYNRGAFTSGYYNSVPGRDMISVTRPNHFGVKALRVLSNDSGKITFRALTDINAGDVFEIPTKEGLDSARFSGADNSFTSGADYKAGDSFVVNLPKRLPLTKGRDIYRMKNAFLTQYVSDNFCQKELCNELDISITALKGSEFIASAKVLSRFKCHELSEDIYACVTGSIVEEAQKSPVGSKDIKKAFVKTGNPFYSVRNIDITMDDDIFIPASSLKSIRRELLDAIDTEIINRFIRTVPEGASENNSIAGRNCLNEMLCDSKLSVHLHGKNGFMAAYNNNCVNRIYIEYTAVLNQKEWQSIVQIKTESEKDYRVNKDIYVVLPHILREDNKKIFNELVIRSLEIGLSGFVIRNLEELGWLSLKKDTIPKVKIITDAGLYVTNSFAFSELKKIVSDSGFDFEGATLSYELTHKELQNVINGVLSLTDNVTIENCDALELPVYGYIPMMISRQCVRKTLGKCNHSNDTLTIATGDKMPLLVQSMCDFCYSVTYKELYNISCAEELSGIPCRQRYEFVNESESEIEDILENGFNGGNEGHFYRKID